MFASILAFSSTVGCMFLPLKGIGNVAKDEGNYVGHYTGASLDECKTHCHGKSSCRSFAYCPGNSCWLKDLILSGNEPTKQAYACTTYYTNCEGEEGEY